MNVCAFFRLFFPLVASLLFFLAVPLGAQEADPHNGLDHHLILGIATMALPKYEGATAYGVLPFPLVEYSNQYFFISTLKGAGVNLIHTPTLTMGPLLTYRFGRRQNHSHLLAGLGNVKGGVEAGAFLHWQFHERLGTDIKFLQGLGSAKGFTADLSLTYNQPLAPNLAFALQTSVAFANAQYNKQYFGITSTQSQGSGYAPYGPGSGIKHVSIMPALQYAFGEHYTVGLFYEYKRLTGPAATSPLVKRGSPNQSTAGMLFTWTY